MSVSVCIGTDRRMQNIIFPGYDESKTCVNHSGPVEKTRQNNTEHQFLLKIAS